MNDIFDFTQKTYLIHSVLISHPTPISYRQPLILQYIHHLKLSTMRSCLKFHNLRPLQAIIYLANFDHFLYKLDMIISTENSVSVLSI